MICPLFKKEKFKSVTIDLVERSLSWSDRFFMIESLELAFHYCIADTGSSMKESLTLALYHQITEIWSSLWSHSDWLFITIHHQRTPNNICFKSFAMSLQIQLYLNVYQNLFSIMPHAPMPTSCLSLPRVPQAIVNSDWPSTVHFTFQLYRFPPVTTERLKLLDPERNSKLKSVSDYPCVLSVINKDGTFSSGMITILMRMLYDSLQHS